MAITVAQARTYVFEDLRSRLGQAQPVTTELVAIEKAVRQLAQAGGIEIDWNGAGEHPISKGWTASPSAQRGGERSEPA